MFMWNPQFQSPLGIRPVNCVLVRGFPRQDDLNQEIQLINVNSAVMTQTENGNNKKKNHYATKWNALFDKTFSQWISFKPKENDMVFPCYSCRDMFRSKSSFLDHVNRRGMLIKYKCPACPRKCPITFYNPCSLLLHTREHYTTTSGEIDLENIDISLVPPGLAGFFQHPDIPMLYDVEEDNLGETQSINTKFYAPSGESEGSRIILLRPLMILFYQLSTPNSQSNRLVLKQLSSNIPSCRFIKYVEEKVNPPPSDSTTINLLSDDIIIKDEPIDIDEDYIDSTHMIVEDPKDSINTDEKKGAPVLKSASCPECHTTQRCKMVEHFLGANKPLHIELNCPVCRFIATTKCSLSAHKRLHLSEAPFVCPECGKDFPQFVQLMDHLDVVCFHLAKSVRYRCTSKHCNKIFASMQSSIEHFSLHMNKLVRCKVCQAIVTSEKWFKAIDPTHNCSEHSEDVYRCSVCVNDLKLYTKETFNHHIHFHCIDDMLRMYVYICKICKNYFRSRENYAFHIVKCQKIKHVPENEDKSKTLKTQSSVWKRLKKLNTTSPNSLKVSYMFKCRYCSNIFNSHVSYTGHLLKCSKKNLEAKPQSKDAMQSLLENEMPQPIRVNCAQCNNKFGILEIQNHLSLCAVKQNVDNEKSEEGRKEDEENCINKIKIADVTSAVNLEQLKEKLNVKENTPDSTEKTLIKSFGGTAIEVQIINTPPPFPRLKKCTPKKKKSPKTVPELEKPFSLDSTSPRSDTPESKRKRKKSASPKSKKQAVMLEDLDSELVQDEPVKFDGTYYCKLCNYENAERDVFQNHVKKHRDGCASYQCMDCGECFVVKPSLIKHLNFIHQISNTDEYFENNDCIDVKEIEGTIGENQCKVCKLEFSDKLELNKHFRVHGMAFLKKMK